MGENLSYTEENWYGTDESLIRQYARLTVRTGVNVQPGQDVVISCPVEHYAFARMVIEEAYAAGAGQVVMRWNDNGETKQYFLHASEEALATVPDWKRDSFNYYSRRGAANISIGGEDPEALSGVDPARMRIHQNAMDKATAEYYQRMMSSEVPWTVVEVPQKAWAKKVFPELSEAEAMHRLWAQILATVRIDGGDVVENWKQHDAFLQEKCRMLNGYNFAKLRYHSGLGTDFTVGLAKNHIWMGGAEKDAAGIPFQANMPTEEIFTTPDRNVAEGTLAAAMPLSYRGNLITDIRLTFHEGRVTEYHASSGEDVLKTIIEADEGSHRLGECAIVPCTSPIAQMGTLFYSTLYDENAACHFAVGACYPTTIKNGASFTEEELLAAGGNVCPNHVDFMVGTDDMTITGIRSDGTEVTFFDHGDWV